MSQNSQAHFKNLAANAIKRLKPKPYFSDLNTSVFGI